MKWGAATLSECFESSATHIQGTRAFVAWAGPELAASARAKNASTLFAAGVSPSNKSLRPGPSGARHRGDLIIAATALHHGLSLATGIVKHFNRIPSLTIEDWTKP